MKLYTEKELRDKAFMIATASNLIETFTYEEFKQIKCTTFSWEPFDDLPEDIYRSHIEESAELTFEVLKEVQENALSNK